MKKKLWLIAAVVVLGIITAAVSFSGAAGNDGKTICTHLQPKQLLDRMRSVCKGKSTYDKDLCYKFNKETRDGKQMERYSALLQDAIRSIIEVKEERDVMSLFSAGETTALTGNVQGLDDFELICFLVIR